MRKIFVLLLLLAGWALIFSPWTSGTLGIEDAWGDSNAFMSPVHPSDAPLPQPWQDEERVQVSSLPAAPAAQRPAGETYTVQRGDTLGQIAKQRGLTLADLLEANPDIGNASLIYPGQQIKFPDPYTGQGSPVTGAIEYKPGASLQVSVSGFPANSSVRVGLGLSVSGYKSLGEYRTDAEGSLSERLTLPDTIKPGEEAFFLVTTEGVPAVQRVSETFVISGR